MKAAAPGRNPCKLTDGAGPRPLIPSDGGLLRPDALLGERQALEEVLDGELVMNWKPTTLPDWQEMGREMRRMLSCSVAVGTGLVASMFLTACVPVDQGRAAATIPGPSLAYVSDVKLYPRALSERECADAAERARAATGLRLQSASGRTLVANDPQGNNIFTIQCLLGHTNQINTVLFVHVASPSVQTELFRQLMNNYNL